MSGHSHLNPSCRLHWNAPLSLFFHNASLMDVATVGASTEGKAENSNDGNVKIDIGTGSNGDGMDQFGDDAVTGRVDFDDYYQLSFWTTSQMNDCLI